MELEEELSQKSNEKEDQAMSEGFVSKWKRNLLSVVNCIVGLTTLYIILYKI